MIPLNAQNKAEDCDISTYTHSVSLNEIARFVLVTADWHHGPPPLPQHTSPGARTPQALPSALRRLRLPQPPGAGHTSLPGAAPARRCCFCCCCRSCCRRRPGPAPAVPACPPRSPRSVAESCRGPGTARRGSTAGPQRARALPLRRAAAEAAKVWGISVWTRRWRSRWISPWSGSAMARTRVRGGSGAERGGQAAGPAGSAGLERLRPARCQGTALPPIPVHGKGLGTDKLAAPRSHDRDTACWVFVLVF